MHQHSPLFLEDSEPQKKRRRQNNTPKTGTKEKKHNKPVENAKRREKVGQISRENSVVSPEEHQGYKIFKKS